VLIVNISDHLPIFHLCNIQSNVPVKAQAKRSHVINARTLEKLQCSLKNQDWSDVLNNGDANEAYNVFHTTFMNCFNLCIPIVTNVYRGNHKPWVTPALLNSIKRKNKLYKQFCKNRCTVTESRYKSYKNKLTMLLRKAEKTYVTKYINKHKTEAKKLWSLINDKLGRNPMSNTLPDVKEGEERELANKFNEYFINVGPTIASSVKGNIDPMSYMGNKYNQSMYVKPVCEKELLEIISDLKDCSAGIDGVKAKIVKVVRDEIKVPLLHLLNLSFKCGVFPDLLKVAVVTPIYKKGDKNVLSNYRPVSVLNVFSKLYERVMNNRLVSYFENSQILYEHQYGFRKGFSTDLAIATATEYILNSLNENQFVCGLYMDLSKAFDVIDHTLLKQKLLHYGIRGPVYKWLDSYLENRKQLVKINNIMSSSDRYIRCGVPQGSILGPTLFLIYVNDICKSSTLLNFVLFADDTNCFKSGSNMDSVFKTVNAELTKVMCWFKANKLLLNANKTHFMLFSRKHVNRVPKIEIDGVEIKRVQSTVFLGVHIDEQLNWKCHIQHVLGKINKGIGILHRLKSTFPGQTLLQVYKSLIHPHFNYCNMVWGCNQNATSELYIAQKKALKIALSLSIRTPSHEVFHKAHMLTLAGINRSHISIFMYKYHNNLLPISYCGKYQQIRDKHTYNVRTCKDYIVPRRSIKSYQTSLQYRAPMLWNMLPSSLKECDSLSVFKSKVKEFYL